MRKGRATGAGSKIRTCNLQLILRRKTMDEVHHGIIDHPVHFGW